MSHREAAGVLFLRTRGARTLLTVIVWAVSAPLSVHSQDQPSPESASESQLQEQIPIEVFKAPHAKHIGAPDCDTSGQRTVPEACKALSQGTEGWVELGFMVDPSGKPFEVMVIRSTGNKTYEEAATRAIEQSTFEPGSVNGKAVESGYEMKYLFANYRSSRGATGQFISAYKTLIKDINAGDRAAADAAIKNLKITNLYEDAYFGLATYSYANKWGAEEQQLAGLRRAIARENTAHYLPADTFRSALLTCLQLELKKREYAEAMTTWKRLEKSGVDAGTLGRLRPVLEQVEKLRSDDSAYDISGLMSDGQWYLHLFKRHFRAEVNAGYISQVKLRCDKRYVSFAFDPKLQYQVNSKDGDCSIEFDGAPGTQFKLTQF